MNLTQVQIEELQQAWQEGMAEIKSFGCLEFGIAVHDITKEVALIISADDLDDVVRVLKHATPADVDALQAFLNAGGCNDARGLLITAADLKGRTSIPVSEIVAQRKPH